MTVSEDGTGDDSDGVGNGSPESTPWLCNSQLSMCACVRSGSILLKKILR